MKKSIKAYVLSNNAEIGYKLIKRYRKSKFYYDSLMLRPSALPYDNIILASVQKSGSQWLKKFFKDPIIQKKTRMAVFPQHDYEYGEVPRRFPKSIIPGIYCSKSYFDNVIRSRLGKHKIVYTIRDPRNIVCSWYNSTLHTHGYTPIIHKQREILETKSFDDGIHYSIDYLADKFSAMRSWATYGRSEVYLNKIEEFNKDPRLWTADLFKYLEIHVTEQELTYLNDKYSREKVRNRDIQNRGSTTKSHYRKIASNHQIEFTAQHYKHFSQATGNLLDLLGYNA